MDLWSAFPPCLAGSCGGSFFFLSLRGCCFSVQVLGGCPCSPLPPRGCSGSGCWAHPVLPRVCAHLEARPRECGALGVQPPPLSGELGAAPDTRHPGCVGRFRFLTHRSHSFRFNLLVIWFLRVKASMVDLRPFCKNGFTEQINVIMPAHCMASPPWGLRPVSVDGHTPAVTPLGYCPSGVNWASCKPQQSPAGQPSPAGARGPTAGLAAGGLLAVLGFPGQAPHSHCRPPCAYLGALGKRTSVKGVCMT